MRASKKAVAIATCLAASVMASESFVKGSDFKRGLHVVKDNNHDKIVFHADDPTTPVETDYPDFTETFAQGPDGYGKDYRSEGWELSERSQIGLLVGFICTGIFILFALVQIIVDEVKRHSDFENKVNTAFDTLRGEPYNYSDD